MNYERLQFIPKLNSPDLLVVPVAIKDIYHKDRTPVLNPLVVFD